MENPTPSHLIGNPDSKAFLEFLWGVRGGGSTIRPWNVFNWAETLDIDEGRDGVAFWEVVIVAWSSFDKIPHREFEEAFDWFRWDVPPRDVAEHLTVYRGQNGNVPNGLSWTLDRKIAEGFSTGDRGIVYPDPVVLKIDISNNQVAFDCNDREEQEIVLRTIPL